MTTGIIDYGAGNLLSVKNALDFLNEDSTIINSPEQMDQISKIILPGVGSFGYTMKTLKQNKLDTAIRTQINEGKPYFGICLGLQILFQTSEESPLSEGLGLLKGDIVKFRTGKIPQIGWNQINPKQDIISKGYGYFVNSYIAQPTDISIIAGETQYYQTFPSVIRKDNILATQFHPEKSGKYGLKLIKRWLKC